jgi:hypothetical protein
MPLEPFFELLDTEKFRKRTAMYLGDKTISSLAAFLNGYYYATEVHNLEDNEDTVRFGDFHDWTARYFGWSESTAGWKNIILKECHGNEELALAKFFELYDIFKAL